VRFNAEPAAFENAAGKPGGEPKQTLVRIHGVTHAKSIRPECLAVNSICSE
jgi:hypothetical protein